MNTKTSTKVMAGIGALIGLIGPAIAPGLQGWIVAHPQIASIVATVSALVALFHDPKKV